MADYEYSGENGDQQFAEDPSNTNFEQQGDIVPVAEAEGGDASAESPGEKINASKNEDDERRKIFVGGLSWETTVKDLRDYFSKFGDVSDCTLKTDPATGRSRGFGFVLFSQSQEVDKVVDHPETHTLHGRTIDPKRANPRGNREPIKKVFVGGLDPETPEDEIRSHFGKFGKIEEIDLPYDKIKGQRRAFCFITFESEGIVDTCCNSPKQTIGTKEVDVKKATPKDQQGSYGYGGRGRGWGNGPQRGRGRGRGGYNSGGWGQDYYGNYDQGYGYGGYGGGNYGGYGNYGGGYDYNYYNNQGWGGYNQGYGYGNGGYGNNSYGGGGGGGGQDSGYGKAKRGGGGGGGGGASAGATSTYHPYSR